MKPSCLAIIPARGGSKGVLRKNIRIVAGQPLIAYSIQAAQASQTLTHCVISTEDDEIASVGRTFGAEVLPRPAELAGDKTPMLPVVRDVFSTLEARLGTLFEYGVLLQPTAPLRTAADIDAAVTLLRETGADSVISVYRVYDHHPARMYRMDNERLVPLQDEPVGRLRQDLPAVYHRNGAIYAFRRKLIDEIEGLIGPDTRPYIMPEERSVNIDNEIDLLLADLLLQRLKSA
jgi:CMP-N,N'-diacetyllegionaminic acid synthase